MPLEKHAERLTTPLTSRDRRLLVAFAAVVVVSVVVGSVFALTRGGARSGERCVSLIVPGSMGGVSIRHCGADAVRWCRREAPHDEAVAEACRRGGFTLGVPPASS